MRRPVLFALLALLAAIGAGAAWWYAQPSPQRAKRSRAARYRAPVAEAWAAISDVGGWAAWQGALRAVEPQPPLRGHAVWREISRDGSAVTAETVEVLEGRRLVRCVVDQGGAFGGCWTWEVAARGEESAAVITEALTIHSRWFALRHPGEARAARLDAILTDLGARLGAEPYRRGDTMVDVSRPLPEEGGAGAQQ